MILEIPCRLVYLRVLKSHGNVKAKTRGITITSQLFKQTSNDFVNTHYRDLHFLEFNLHSVGFICFERERQRRSLVFSNIFISINSADICIQKRHQYFSHELYLLLEITIVSKCCALYWLHRFVPWFRSLQSLNCDT